MTVPSVGIHRHIRIVDEGVLLCVGDVPSLHLRGVSQEHEKTRSVVRCVIAPGAYHVRLRALCDTLVRTARLCLLDTELEG